MFQRLDNAIFSRVIKIAHWADYRWHINTYMIAKYLTQLAAVCVLLAGAATFIPIPKSGLGWYAIIVCLNLLIAWSYLVRADKLQGASDRYERGDEKFVPRLAITNYMLGPAPRLIAAFVAILLATTLVPIDLETQPWWPLAILWFMARLWLFWGDCIAIYFSMVPPSGRSRKPKKARDWSVGLTPQTVGGHHV